MEHKIFDKKTKLIIKLISIESFLKHTKKYKTIDNIKCLQCNYSDYMSIMFEFKKYKWSNLLIHYIVAHNLYPTKLFIDDVMKFNKSINKKHIIKFKSKKYKINNLSFIKIKKNQLQILDALMYDGSKIKYKIKKNKYGYSEHAGLLDFNNTGLERFIVSGMTNRHEKNDDQILLPNNMPDAIDYEYMFHTHPPTPTPGGRIGSGLLYEFPSYSDILHFIEHHNIGITQGSIVITPEGLYNIRKLLFNREFIKINEDAFIDEFNDIFYSVQHSAIKKYGKHFTIELFYQNIAQDLTYINTINKMLNKHDITIDYYPRILYNNQWILPSIYLPIYIVEPIK